MISEYMGPHYGNDVSLPGAGDYQLSLLVSPPVSARHVEYQNVWLSPHRVTVTLPLAAGLMSASPTRGPARVTRRRFFLGAATVAAGGAAGVGARPGSTARAAPPEIPRVALGPSPPGFRPASSLGPRRSAPTRWKPDRPASRSPAVL